MADQSTSEPVVPLPPATEGGERHDQPDLTGQNILTLLHKAASLAEGNSQYAIAIAQKLSNQLCTAENRVEELEARVAELEAEVQLYRDKSEKAEQWLGKISTEIQERVLGNQD
jgi:chromosome segregation ATPase